MRKIIDRFRKLTAPLDWLEFGAFVIVFCVVGLLIIWSFVSAAIEGLSKQDFFTTTIALTPVVLIIFSFIQFFKTRKLNWFLLVFVIIVAGIAFYMLYF